MVWKSIIRIYRKAKLNFPNYPAYLTKDYSSFDRAYQYYKESSKAWSSWRVMTKKIVNFFVRDLYG